MSEMPSSIEEAHAAIVSAEKAAQKARGNLVILVVTETRGNRSEAARLLGRSYRQLCRDIKTLGIGARLVELEREHKWPAWGWGHQE